MKVMVIDGQGGGLGSSIITQLKAAEIGGLDEIIAVGTNALATSAMLRAGATAGATGENAVLYNAGRADVILGPIGIIVSNSMYGEISPAISAAISGCDATKILVPSLKCSVQVAGTEQMTMSEYVSRVIKLVRDIAEANL